MNFATICDKAKAFLMPLALGVIALAHNPATANLLPPQVTTWAIAIAALAHALETKTNPALWNGETKPLD